MPNEIAHDDLYRFTLSEAASVSTISEMTLRNWISRDVVKVGQKHRLGRWLFSGADIVRLRVMGDLIAVASMPPAQANEVADLVVARHTALAEWDYEAEQRGEPQKLQGWLRHYVAVWRDGEEIKRASYTEERDPVALSSKTLEERPWLKGAHLIIPADYIVFEVTHALAAVLHSQMDEDSEEELLAVLEKRIAELRQRASRTKSGAAEENANE
ncbi:MerR family transcriptional regulator [Rhizobium sp. LjRoot254]|uniref:MerR family transcriptional regulator n=1 Tax=Rhizobium sp. LjRoot254 TaxID=3342297 RepID=UPI003ECF004A